jgi:type II secretory pathway component PulC
MVDLKVGLAISAIVIMIIMVIMASIISEQILAAKKSSTKSSSSGSKSSSKTTTKKTTTIHHVKGVKVFHVHAVPSKVTVGSTFSFRGIVFNNSTATITFSNGTCTAPLSITFNKNVMTEPQTTTGTCKPQEVTLKPGEQSPILSPNLSGITYRATSPGSTNATMTFKYGAIPTTSKSPISDSITRVFTFNIMPSGVSPSKP